MKKFFKILGIILLIIIVSCGIWFLYFTLKYKDSFYNKTYINNVNVSNTNVDIAQTLIKDSVLKKDFLIKSNGEEVAKINLEKDLNAQIKFDSELQRILIEEKSLTFKDKLQKKKEYTINLDIDIKEDTLKKVINEFDFSKGENQVDPQNAYIDFLTQECKYQIIPEVIGTKLDETKLYQLILDKLTENIYEIDLVKDDIATIPDVLASDKDLIETCEEANKYLETVITYQVESDEPEILDKTTIQDFFSISEDNVLSIEYENIEEYVNYLESKFGTSGGTRTFESTKRGSVVIAGGDYGFLIDKDAEIEEIVSNMKDGKTIEREPCFTQKAMESETETEDIGKSYIEIDLTNQHLWFYLDGEMLIESDCITGLESEESDEYSTPPGVYSLKTPEEDYIVKSKKQEDGTYEEEQPVNYWLPFNKELGLHDASWRATFGGDIYKTNGSYGCIELPENIAKTIFEKAKEGIPVVIYK